MPERASISLNFQIENQEIGAFLFLKSIGILEKTRTLTIQLISKPKRILFLNDGLMFVTYDHYTTFSEAYWEDDYDNLYD